MKLNRQSANSYVLDMARGQVLFSYGVPVAVRHLDGVFRSPAAILTPATRGHIDRFAPGRLPPVLSGRQFVDLCKVVLNG